MSQPLTFKEDLHASCDITNGQDHNKTAQRQIDPVPETTGINYYNLALSECSISYTWRKEGWAGISLHSY